MTFIYCFTSHHSVICSLHSTWIFYFLKIQHGLSCASDFIPAPNKTVLWGAPPSYLLLIIPLSTKVPFPHFPTYKFSEAIIDSDKNFLVSFHKICYDINYNLVWLSVSYVLLLDHKFYCSTIGSERRGHGSLVDWYLKRPGLDCILKGVIWERKLCFSSDVRSAG